MIFQELAKFSSSLLAHDFRYESCAKQAFQFMMNYSVYNEINGMLL